jgi:hypothetical protein
MSNINTNFVFNPDQKINEIFKEFNISGYDMLREILRNYKDYKCNEIPIEDTPEYIESKIKIKKESPASINIKETDEYKLLQEELNDLKKEKRRSVYYDASEDIGNNNEIVKLTSEISNLTKIIKDNQINHKKEVDDLKTHYDGIISELKKKENVPLPSPTNSNENKNIPSRLKNIFDNKNLSILKRCKVDVYKFDEKNTKENDLHILKYIASENKILIRFNSIVTEKVKEEDLWKKIYYFKVKNGDLKDYSINKQRFKYKYLRCKELYNKYGENLKFFKMNIINIGKLTDDDWKLFLSEFDKLYHDTFKNMEACQHKYKDNNICGIFDCTINHKNYKYNI